MKILLTANEAAGSHTFRLLSNSEHEVTGIITPEANTSLRRMAAASDIPVLEPRLLRDAGFSGWINENDVDVLLNVHLLEIIHSDIIKSLKVGGFNLHPGPLPEYAGLNTPSWGIYNGESTYGVTLHWLYPGVDTGPIAYQSLFPLTQGETGLTLSNRCTMEGMELIKELLDTLSGSPSDIPEITQDLENRKYYLRNDIPQKGKIEWNKTAAEIDRFVRACNYGPFGSPWGNPVTTFNEQEVELLAVKPTTQESEGTPGTIHVDAEGNVLISTTDYDVEVVSCKANGKTSDPGSIFLQNKGILT